MKRWLVAYDVPDDMRRTRLAKVLEDYGDRVQYSVFEVFVTEPKLKRMLDRVKDTIDEGEDSVRIYPNCDRCLKSIMVVGVAKRVEPWYDPDYYII